MAKDVSPGLTAKAPPGGVQSPLIVAQIPLPGPGPLMYPGGGEGEIAQDPGVAERDEYGYAYPDCLPPLSVEGRNGGEGSLPEMVAGPAPPQHHGRPSTGVGSD